MQRSSVWGLSRLVGCGVARRGVTKGWVAGVWVAGGWVIAVSGGLGCTPGSANPAPSSASATGSAAAATLPPHDRVAKLALGDGHSCALLASGRVACWGDNGMGQLGNGSDQASPSPVFVNGVLDAVDLRASRATTCVTRKTGAVACWGDNAYGQANPVFDAALTGAKTPWGVYDGTNEPPRFTPANVLRSATPSTAAAGARGLALGSAHGCALLGGGGVRCWGDASHGQLGVGAPSDAFEARPVAGVPPFVEIASAQFYSCGRTAGGAVWCWGANDDRQLGTEEPGPRPRPVPGVAGASGIQLAGNRACASLAGGRVMCWGDSLACGEDHAEPPALAPRLAGSVQFARAAAECFWCALDARHELACDGDPIANVHFDLPSVSSVAAGIYHACALRSDGSVWCWGGNPNGELGRKTAKDKDPEPGVVLWPDPSPAKPLR